ncbi:hypothetical protein F8M41_025168 [Gigaspora margarita]|uniref:Uncharacterized protein n=1 Tax=Gigaspora margarita TaxID=4874 RepID=A0A8H3XKL1_GIGMA|nr:hypothetical protein F8M41_025168 [Gigaspora margarita]
MELLTTVLLKYQKENNEYLLDSEQFQQMIELNEPKLNIAKAHPIRINEYFNLNANTFYCFNIDDFHDIYRIRKPNTTTLSSVNHMATCTYDLSYNFQKFNWIKNQIQLEDQNQNKLLTIHIYGNAISERKEERSIKNLKIIGIQEQNLYLTKDYLDALKMITS